MRGQRVGCGGKNFVRAALLQILVSLATAFPLLSTSGCGRDPCLGVTCSGHGKCLTSGQNPVCACDPGFTAQGLGCAAVAVVPACTATGNTCSANSACCNFKDGTGSCVSGRCTDSCTSNSGCVSGCCAPLQSGGRACGSASLCTSCTSVGGACSVNGDCCNWQAGQGFCVNRSTGTLCVDSCTGNSQCNSNCCAPLNGTGAGSVCSPRSFCP